MKPSWNKVIENWSFSSVSSISVLWLLKPGISQQEQHLPVMRTSVCKASVRIGSKLFTESSAMILCVISNLSKPRISYNLPLLSLQPFAICCFSQKHSLNHTEELSSLIDQRKSDTHHKGCSDYCSELSTFSVVCLSTIDSKSIILQYKKMEVRREQCFMFIIQG